MPVPQHAPSSVRFGPFELSAEAEELRKHGIRLKLSGQALQVLALLVENAGQVVTREELQRKLWPTSSFGDFEHGLNAAVNRLRETLGDSAAEPTIVETVPRRGYRFIASISSGTSKEQPTRDIAERSPKSSTSAERSDIGHIRSRRFASPLVLLLSSIGVIVAALLPRLPIRVADPPLTAVPLTALEGNAAWPSFSPDGRQVVFGWDQNQGWPNFELFVKAVDGSDQPLQLTHTHRPDILLTRPAWSPDGKWIAFCRFHPAPGQKPVELVLIPAPNGGHETVLQKLNPSGETVSWSPDSRYIALSDRESPQEPSALFLLERETLGRRKITAVPEGTSAERGDSDPIFSPDGKYIAFLRTLNSGRSELAVLALATGEVRVVLSETGTMFGMAWSPGGEDIVYASDKAAIRRLWRVPVKGGDSRPLSIGEDARSLAILGTKHLLAYGRGFRDSNIWHIRLGKDGKLQSRTSLVVSPRQDDQAVLSPDETKIAFSSDRSGFDEIWASNRDGSDVVQLTHLNSRGTGAPRWSPDGTQIAFAARVSKQADVFLVGFGGAVPRRLTDDGFDNSAPSWSSDGTSIYYQSNRSGVTQIWKMPVEGGQPVQLTTHGGQAPIESADGRILYFVRTNVDTAELWEKRLRDGIENRVGGLLDINDPLNYQVTDQGVYFVAPDAQGWAHSSLKYFDFITHQTRDVAFLGNRMFASGISISKDRTEIVYAQQDHIGLNLMLVENFR